MNHGNKLSSTLETMAMINFVIFSVYDRKRKKMYITSLIFHKRTPRGYALCDYFNDNNKVLLISTNEINCSDPWN